MTQATTEELPGRTPGRAARIAAIHAFADWLAEHPEAPMPWKITGDVWYHRGVSGEDKRSEPERVEAALTVMRQLDIKPYEGATTVQGNLTVLHENVHGIAVVYSVAAFKDHASDARYLDV